MLSEERLKHSLGVARQCYSLSKELNLAKDDKEAKLYWLMGFLHDIGYEFSDGSKHAEEGYEILKSINTIELNNIKWSIRHHGKADIDSDNDYLNLLNLADMTVDSKGNICTLDERLKDIKERHEENSEAYKTAQKVKENLKWQK